MIRLRAARVTAQNVPVVQKNGCRSKSSRLHVVHQRSHREQNLESPKLRGTFNQTGQVGRGGIVGVDVVLRGHPWQALLSQQFYTSDNQNKRRII